MKFSRFKTFCYLSTIQHLSIYLHKNILGANGHSGCSMSRGSQMVGCSGARTLPRLGSGGGRDGGGGNRVKDCQQNGGITSEHILGRNLFYLLSLKGYLKRERT